jgi:hypothetical protein
VKLCLAETRWSISPGPNGLNAPNDNNEPNDPNAINALNDPNDHMHPEQIRIFKAMEPEKKLKLAQMLYDSARELKTASLKARYPEWSEEKIKDRVREIFLYART